jgi:GNAT superfamily N-acetyltransferase
MSPHRRAVAESARAAPSGPPRVRLARPEDASLLIDLRWELARESEGLELDPEALGSGVRAVFDDPTLGEYWLAELDRRAAGCLLVTREWSDWRNGTVLWIHSVYVRPEARGRGVYRALYQHQRRRVEADPDLVGIRLYVDRSNRRAHQVYEHLGMARGHYVLFEWMK